MITKAQQPDGLWRYECDDCKVVRVVKYADLRNPCRCGIQEIVEVEFDARAKLNEPSLVRKAVTKEKSAPRPGLGDHIETALQSVGVTKERWAAFKAAAGLPATCSCGARKQYLNKLGDELGQAAKRAVASLFGKKKALPADQPEE